MTLTPETAPGPAGGYPESDTPAAELGERANPATHLAGVLAEATELRGQIMRTLTGDLDEKQAVNEARDRVEEAFNEGLVDPRRGEELSHNIRRLGPVSRPPAREQTDASPARQLQREVFELFYDVEDDTMGPYRIIGGQLLTTAERTGVRAEHLVKMSRFVPDVATGLVREQTIVGPQIELAELQDQLMERKPSDGEPLDQASLEYISGELDKYIHYLRQLAGLDRRHIIGLLRQYESEINQGNEA